MIDTTQAQARWFHLTPGRFVLALLAVEVLLWLSERFGWLGWHKGYAVLTGVAVVGVGMLVMGVWFAGASIFRRRFQFSLRWLLVLVVVVALPCGWLAVEIQKAREQREAVAAIRKLKSTDCYYEVKFVADPLLLWMTLRDVPVEPGYRHPPNWPWNLLRGDFFEDVNCVSFIGSNVTDIELKRLTGLPRLQVLLFGENRITDAGLEQLSGLGRLGGLYLTNTQITDHGLIHLQGLRQLRCLFLNGTWITDDGVPHLQSLTQLQVLCVANTKVTDAGVAKLQQSLPNCKITR